MHPITSDLFTLGVPLLEKIIRTVAVYLFLLVGLRVAGKRELGQLNPFDLIVLLVLSNTVQNAIIGDDNSLVGGIVSATVLLLLNWAVVRFLYKHPTIDRLAEGDPVILVQDGKVLQESLERELVTEAELVAAARRQGIEQLSEVACARLEVGGALTFIPVHPSASDMQHAEVMRRLDDMEARMMEGLRRAELE